MLQSLHHVYRQTIIGVAKGDVGVVKLPPAHHAYFMTLAICQNKNNNSICYFYTFIITEKNMSFEMHQYDIKNMSL